MSNAICTHVDDNAEIYLNMHQTIVTCSLGDLPWAGVLPDQTCWETSHTGGLPSHAFGVITLKNEILFI